MSKSQNNSKTLIILDANAIIHRAYHALPDFRTTKGELVNAVYGFISILLKVLREFEPDYIAAAFDMPGPTFRHEEYEEYKAKRVKAPDELYAQIPKIKEVLDAFNISIYEKESFEADDIIGTIAKLVQKKGVRITHPIQTIIVSGDLDTLQLVNNNTRVYTMRKGLKDTVIYDEEAVKKRFGGLTPDQMVDYKGLRGDPSDNIPGVVGVGEKTAIRLLSDFVSLDNLYKELEENTDKSKTIKPKLRDTLIKYKDQAFFSRELVTVRIDVPIDFKIENLLWKDYRRDEVERVFNKFNFRSLLGRLPEPAAEITSRKSSPEQVEGAVGKSGSEDPTYERIEGLYRDNVFSKEIYELENNLVPIIRAMEKEGIKIAKDYFYKLSKEVTKELVKAEENIFKISGKKFNINSPQQLSEVLFGELQLPIKGLKKTPGGVVSTAAGELEKLLGKHPIIKELLKYREFQKLYSTYIKPLPKHADDKDRIHTKFDQVGTATGRISSSAPNMQNIPIRGEWGTKIRKGFIAEQGFKFVSFDYSQMELRLAAHISQDSKMKEFFNRGEDIHEMTASEVFNISKDKVSKDMRYKAKALNFGVLYGMGASGFAKSANISRDEAQTFIDSYFTRFPGILRYIESTKESARKKGYVSTIFGRKRYIPDITSSNPPLRAQAERMAINHPIQGTAADIIKMAMVAINSPSFVPTSRSFEGHSKAMGGKQLSTVNCRLLLQIHDELLFEIQNDRIEKTYPFIKNIMENACSLSIPLEVDVLVGPSWGELEKVE